MSRSFKFANMLAAELRDGIVEPMPRSFYHVRGQFDIGVEIVKLDIAVPWLFRDLKRHPPLAACGASWMRTGAEWHNGRVMCWVLPNEWRDAMNWKGKPVRAILNEGREWFFNNVCNLLNRHYTADIEGLEAWDSDWAYWDHYQAGVLQYERDKRLR